MQKRFSALDSLELSMEVRCIHSTIRHSVSRYVHFCHKPVSHLLGIVYGGSLHSLYYQTFRISVRTLLSQTSEPLTWNCLWRFVAFTLLSDIPYLGTWAVSHLLSVDHPLLHYIFMNPFQTPITLYWNQHPCHILHMTILTGLCDIGAFLSLAFAAIDFHAIPCQAILSLIQFLDQLNLLSASNYLHITAAKDIRFGTP